MKKQKPLIERYVSYHQIRRDDQFPSSRIGFFLWIVKSIKESFKRHFPKNLLLFLALGLGYWLFNLVFLGIMNDSCFFGSGKYANVQVLPYLFAGLIKNGSFKGFDWIPGGSTTTWFYNLTFMMSLSWLLQNWFRSMKQNGFFGPLKNYFSILKNIGRCKKSATVPVIRTVFLWMGIAFLFGFVIKSPFSVAFLALWLLASFGQGDKSILIYLIFVYQGAVNAKRKKPDDLITGADSALVVLGLAFGMFLYFIVIIVLWIQFDYRIWPRVLSLLILGGFFLFVGITGKLWPTSKTGKAMASLIVSFGLYQCFTQLVVADDGGWSESGRTIGQWLQNPGTQMMETAGLGGPAGMIIGWLGNMVAGGILDHFTGGVGAAVAGTAGGAMEHGGTLGLGLGAYNAALGPLGPVGDLFGNAWGSAIDALAGGGQGGNESYGGSQYSDTGSSSYRPGSTGNSNNSSTDHKTDLTEEEVITEKDEKDE